MRVVVSSVSSPSDGELVQRLQKRDQGAFVRTYELYSARLHGYLLRLTQDRAIAEDLFQETWCRLAGSVHALRAETDLFAWLLTVARNLYFDRARSIARFSPLSLVGRSDLMSYTHLPDEETQDREQLRLLEQALSALSDVDREVLLLVGVEALSHASAAEILGLGAVAFRKRLSRARERLEAALDRLTAMPSLAKGVSRE